MLSYKPNKLFIHKIHINKNKNSMNNVLTKNKEIIYAQITYLKDESQYNREWEELKGLKEKNDKKNQKIGQV